MTQNNRQARIDNYLAQAERAAAQSIENAGTWLEGYFAEMADKWRTKAHSI